MYLLAVVVIAIVELALLNNLNKTSSKEEESYTSDRMVKFDGEYHYCDSKGNYYASDNKYFQINLGR